MIDDSLCLTSEEQNRTNTFIKLVAYTTVLFSVIQLHMHHLLLVTRKRDIFSSSGKRSVKGGENIVLCQRELQVLQHCIRQKTLPFMFGRLFKCFFMMAELLSDAVDGD